MNEDEDEDEDEEEEEEEEEEEDLMNTSVSLASRAARTGQPLQPKKLPMARCSRGTARHAIFDHHAHPLSPSRPALNP